MHSWQAYTAGKHTQLARQTACSDHAQLAVSLAWALVSARHPSSMLRRGPRLGERRELLSHLERDNRLRATPARGAQRKSVRKNVEEGFFRIQETI